MEEMVFYCTLLPIRNIISIIFPDSVITSNEIRTSLFSLTVNRIDNQFIIKMNGNIKHILACAILDVTEYKSVSVIDDRTFISTNENILSEILDEVIDIPYDVLKE